jgi:hypothetical protein
LDLNRKIYAGDFSFRVRHPISRVPRPAFQKISLRGLTGEISVEDPLRRNADTTPVFIHTRLNEAVVSARSYNVNALQRKQIPDRSRKLCRPRSTRASVLGKSDAIRARSYPESFSDTGH